MILHLNILLYVHYNLTIHQHCTRYHDSKIHPIIRMSTAVEVARHCRKIYIYRDSLSVYVHAQSSWMNSRSCLIFGGMRHLISGSNVVDIWLKSIVMFPFPDCSVYAVYYNQIENIFIVLMAHLLRTSVWLYYARLILNARLTLNVVITGRGYLVSNRHLV